MRSALRQNLSARADTFSWSRARCYTPNFCAFAAFAAMTKILRPNIFRNEKRGYPTHLFDFAIQKAFSNCCRDTLNYLWPKFLQMIKSLYFWTFHPFNYKVSDVIIRNFQILKNDPETSGIFTHNPLISFRSNKNIQDNLVRRTLRQNIPATAGTFSCSRIVVTLSIFAPLQR